MYKQHSSLFYCSRLYLAIVMPFIPLATFPQAVQANAPYDGGSNDGWAVGDLDCLVLGGANFQTCNNQEFAISDTPISAGTFAFEFNTGFLPTAASDLKLIIPSTLDMRWDRSVVATLNSSAASKINPNPIFSADNKTITFNVVTDLTAGDYLQITGLFFTNFRSFSPINDSVDCDTNNDGIAEKTDSSTKFISRQVSLGNSPTNPYAGGAEDGWFLYDYSPSIKTPDAVNVGGGDIQIQSGTMQIY